MPGAVQLSYSPSTDPFPLSASPKSGELVSCVLTVIASNPSRDPGNNPVTVQGIQITLPIGDSGTALTASAPEPTDVVAPDGWQLQPNTPAGVYAFVPVPPATKVQVTGESLEFTFNNVYVNRQPGGVKGIEVAEGTGGCRPPHCPTVDLPVTKFPYGWGQVRFWVNPPNLRQGHSTTLNWSGPEDATYAIEYGMPTGVVNVPAVGQPPLASRGTYPGKGQPPLVPPPGITVFTLTVTETIAGTDYSAEQQQLVTVAQAPPTIDCFEGKLSYDGAGAYTATLRWSSTGSRYCLVPEAGAQELAPQSPPQGLPVPVRSPRIDLIHLEATNDAGTTASQLTLDWGVAAQFGELGGTVAQPIDMAVSPDGKRLYVVAGGTLNALGLSDDPTALPTRLKSMPGWDPWFVAGAANPHDGVDMFWAVGGGQGPAYILPLMAYDDGSMVIASQTLGLPYSVAPRGIATAPDGSIVYCANREGAGQPTLWVYTPTQWEEGLTTIGSLTLSDWVVGVATASDGTVYVATAKTVASYRQAGGTMTLIAQVSAGDPSHNTQVRDLAVAGDTLFVARADATLVLDRTTLQAARSPLGVSGDSIVAHPDGTHLFAANWAAPEMNVVAPATLTGGVPCP